MAIDKLQVLNEHTLGADNPVLHIIGYGDFQCILSRSASEVISQLLKTHDRWFSFTFRNYPCRTINQYAFDAACAVEAAGKQGRYWEMHHAVYRAQAKIGDDLFLRLAKLIGLDVRQFVADSISKNIHKKIHLDLLAGDLDGVRNTPSFLINGKFFHGSTMELFEIATEILSELVEKKQTTKGLIAG